MQIKINYHQEHFIHIAEHKSMLYRQANATRADLKQVSKYGLSLGLNHYIAKNLGLNHYIAETFFWLNHWIF